MALMNHELLLTVLGKNEEKIWSRKKREDERQEKGSKERKGQR